jgi:beta-catenin-like protein 1
MPDAPSPEMLKRFKEDTEMAAPPQPTPQSNGSSLNKGKSRAPRVEDEDEADASADFAPGNDADYYVEEDDEGRFFGGGLTDEQKTILNIFDKAPGRHEDAQEDVSCTVYPLTSSFDVAETRRCV